MGKIKVRYLVVKRQKGHPLFYWQPNKGLRQAGFLPRRLAERTNDIVDAIKQAEELNADLDRWRSGVEKVPAPPGSLPWLIKMYRQDARFTDLRDTTQQNYNACLKRIEAWSERAGHPPAKTVTRKDVKTFAKSMLATPAMAKCTTMVLKVLFSFAIDEGELDVNPATNMRLRSNPPRQQVWEPEQVDAVIAAAAAEGLQSIGLAVALAYNTGQRQGDILKMAWSQFNGTTIRLRQSKTKTLLDVPCTRSLLEILANTPRTGTLMVIYEQTRRPWHRSFFNEVFRKIARAAGIPDDLQFRDLRRTAVVRLAEAGLQRAGNRGYQRAQYRPNGSDHRGVLSAHQHDGRPRDYQAGRLPANATRTKVGRVTSVGGTTVGRIRRGRGLQGQLISFHNNAAETLEDAVDFYTSTTFAESRSGGFRGGAFDFTPGQVDQVAAFLRAINAHENVRYGNVLSVQAQRLRGSQATDRIREVIAETEDAIEVLEGSQTGRFRPTVPLLRAALGHERRALHSRNNAKRNRLLQQAQDMKTRAIEAMFSRRVASR